MADTKAIHYAAFLRGIGPGDPRKSNESLRSICVSLGFLHVRSFISSGNILFESEETDEKILERKVEKAFRDVHEIEVATFIRSKKALESFVARAQFGQLTHSHKTYLTVTFLKKKISAKNVRVLLEESQLVVRSYDAQLHAVCAVVDNSAIKTPDFMLKLEKVFGKEITTRTFNTVTRIVARL